MKKTIIALFSLTMLGGCSKVSELETKVAGLEQELADHKQQNDEMRTELESAEEQLKKDADNIHFLCAATAELSIPGVIYLGDYTFFSLMEGKPIVYDAMMDNCLVGLEDYKKAVQSRNEDLSSPPPRPGPDQ